MSTSTKPQSRIAYARRKGLLFADCIEEAWKRHHADALQCLDVQDLIVDINEHFTRIMDIDQQIRCDYAAGLAYDERLDMSMMGLVEMWAKVTACVVDVAHRLEASGYAVDGAYLLASNLAEAEAILGSSAPREADFTALAALRDQAVEDDRAGLSEPLTMVD